MSRGFFDASRLTDEQLARTITDLVERGLVVRIGEDTLRLTEKGRAALEAQRAHERGEVQ